MKIATLDRSKLSMACKMALQGRTVEQAAATLGVGRFVLRRLINNSPEDADWFPRLPTFATLCQNLGLKMSEFFEVEDVEAGGALEEDEEELAPAGGEAV